MMKPLDELTELEVLEWWAIQGQNIFLGVELETVLREQGYLMGALGITESGLWRLEVLRHEQTKAQLDAWQALGRELVKAFEIQRHAGDSDGISIVVDESDRFGGSMTYWNFDYKEDKVKRRVALIRLLELLSAKTQPD